jgi:phosphoglycolate phosphatase-like HAD superfamily hydrolase
MNAPQAALRSFQPSHAFFVGIDSDGCAFDTMELKHKECFIPNTIRCYGLQAASKYAREAAEFVNLYSRWRGINRFPSLTMTIDLLRERPEVTRRGVKLPDLEPLRRWCGSGKPLANPSLKEEIAATKDAALALALEWSEAVNRDIAAMVHGVSPFPYVRECLERIREFADAMCVSATPIGALTAEWKEHDLAQYVCLIAGQEVGSKKDVIRAAAASGYEPAKVLMIGDAPGDLEAARASNALFYPIVPGDEEPCWERLHREALEKLRNGTYAGAYESALIDGFLKRLPSTPPWRN